MSQQQRGRQYDLPNSDEIGGRLVGDFSENSAAKDIVVEFKSSKFQIWNLNLWFGMFCLIFAAKCVHIFSVILQVLIWNFFWFVFTLLSLTAECKYVY